VNEWQENPKTTPQQETQLELPLPNSSEDTEETVEEMVTQLTGQLYRQTTFCASLVQSLEWEQQYSLGTPVMEVHMSSALLAMVSLTMSTSDLLRTYIATWKASLWISANRAHIESILDQTDALIAELLEAAHQ